MSRDLPLRGLRVVATTPPGDWFYGLARQYATLYADTLRAMGARVMTIAVVPFLADDDPRAKETVKEVAAFRPDLAFGLHDAGYAMLCRARRRPDLAPTNVFVDWLELPTVLLWDHALLQFAPILLGELPDHPDHSRPGCLATLRAELSHPLFLHVARDSGHREVVHALGVLPRERVLLEPAFAHPSFGAARERGRPGHVADLAFFGNVRALRLDQRPARHHDALGELRETALAEKLARLDAPLWDVLVRRIGELPPPLRQALHLDVDHSFYWSLLCSEIEVGQTRLRLAVLQSLARALDFYGEVGSPEPLGPLRPRPERFAFGAELARAFAGTKVVVDLVNQGFIHGVGTKVMNCFAAGGFMLLDRKQDFVDLFGGWGDAVSYSSLGELREKVDHFLADERERAELSAALGERIRAEHSLPSLLGRLVDRALALRP
jgi:hypothetical protein